MKIKPWSWREENERGDAAIWGGATIRGGNTVPVCFLSISVSFILAADKLNNVDQQAILRTIPSLVHFHTPHAQEHRPKCFTNMKNQFYLNFLKGSVISCFMWPGKIYRAVTLSQGYRTWGIYRARELGKSFTPQGKNYLLKHQIHLCERQRGGIGNLQRWCRGGKIFVKWPTVLWRLFIVASRSLYFKSRSKFRKRKL